MDEDLFALFDVDQEIEVTHRNLPHWQQTGKTYFITFRTIDSLPRAVVNSWCDERNAWLRAHGIDAAKAAWREALARLPATARREFHRAFSQRFHELLDECHGECVLRRAELAKIVGDSLLHFDGVRYEMGDFVVMPNHVHLLAQFTGQASMPAQCESWKHFTATRIHEALGRRGHFWQGESFDHLVRSPESFEAIRRYIADNPRKANLRAGEYLHYVRKK